MTRKSRKRKIANVGVDADGAGAKLVKQPTFDQMWTELKTGIDLMFSCQGMTKPQFMALYTYPWIYDKTFH